MSIQHEKMEASVAAATIAAAAVSLFFQQIKLKTP